MIEQHLQVKPAYWVLFSSVIVVLDKSLQSPPRIKKLHIHNHHELQDMVVIY